MLEAIVIDLYTKTVLTVIALALCVIAARGTALVDPATAQARTCGDNAFNACHVQGKIQVSGEVFTR
jgi:hypothetical protein